MYKITRCYYDRNKSNRTIKTGLTLEEAQAKIDQVVTDIQTEWEEGTGEFQQFSIRH